MYGSVYYIILYYNIILYTRIHTQYYNIECARDFLPRDRFFRRFPPPPPNPTIRRQSVRVAPTFYRANVYYIIARTLLHGRIPPRAPDV